MNIERANTIDKVLLSTDDVRKITEWNNENTDINYDEIKMPFLEAIIVQDIINTSEEELIRIIETDNANAQLKNKFISMTAKEKKKFIKEMNAQKTYTYFKIDPNSGDMEVCELDYEESTKSYIKLFSFTVSFAQKKVNVVDKKYYINSTYSKELEEMITSRLVMLISDTTKYIAFREQDIKVSESHVTRTKKQKNGKANKNKGNKKRTVRLSVRTYSLYSKKELDDIKKYNRHVEAWSVRGHFRHYKKTGKTVWVHPYVKGTGLLEGKEYKL